MEGVVQDPVKRNPSVLPLSVSSDKHLASACEPRAKSAHDLRDERRAVARIVARGGPTELPTLGQTSSKSLRFLRETAEHATQTFVSIVRIFHFNELRMPDWNNKAMSARTRSRERLRVRDREKQREKRERVRLGSTLLSGLGFVCAIV